MIKALFNIPHITTVCCLLTTERVLITWVQYLVDHNQNSNICKNQNVFIHVKAAIV